MNKSVIDMAILRCNIDIFEQMKCFFRERQMGLK